MSAQGNALGYELIHITSPERATYIFERYQR